jgi:NIPSNAP
MIYELRIYRIADGRMDDIRERMLERVPSLFDKHGLRVFGHWSVIVGARLPCFVYMLEFDDASEREEAWKRFYADENWWRIRSETDGGEELVLDYDVILLKSAPDIRLPMSPQAVGPDAVCELVYWPVAIGRKEAACVYFETEVLPMQTQAGARVLAVLEVTAGRDVPSFALLLCWPSCEMLRKSWEAFDRRMKLGVQRGLPSTIEAPAKRRTSILMR